MCPTVTQNPLILIHAQKSEQGNDDVKPKIEQLEDEEKVIRAQFKSSTREMTHLTQKQETLSGRQAQISQRVEVLEKQLTTSKSDAEKLSQLMHQAQFNLKDTSEQAESEDEEKQDSECEDSKGTRTLTQGARFFSRPAPQSSSFEDNPSTRVPITPRSP